jgi:hypothetical protein
MEVKGLLEILAKATSLDSPREELQKDEQLLITAIGESKTANYGTF